MKGSFSIKSQLVNVSLQEIYPAEITVTDGIITSVNKIDSKELDSNDFILPGFIDSHVHIESSMLVPSEFARLAVVHGTVATVSDPHEIGNVCGMEGVEFMIENGKTVPFKFYFGAPSCVPATIFETAGSQINAEQVAALLGRAEIKYLSEMMNFPGVLSGDAEVMKKINAAKKLDKPIDGHAPGLRGEQAQKYIQAGIFTDHECFTAEEALDKLKYGMNILIREGSAARNFEALIDLMSAYPDKMMFCSDDKHPDSLVLGHINDLCARAVEKGINVFNVLKAACINPVKHYDLNVGMLKEGDPADFIIAHDLKNFRIRKTFINGQLVAEEGVSLIKTTKSPTVNNFSCSRKTPPDFAIPYHNEKSIDVIEALDGQLITNRLSVLPFVRNNEIISDQDSDILKIVVVNRYADAPVAKAFIKNIGIKNSALASSVAHDSHNIVAVGTDDETLCRAVNLVIQEKGGISAVGMDREMILPLPVAGLMSNRDGYLVAEDYTAIDALSKQFGSLLGSPFMTLSFMALLVIPHLKLSDRGLFDGDAFSFVGENRELPGK